MGFLKSNTCSLAFSRIILLLFIFFGTVKGKTQENRNEKSLQRESKEYLYTASEELNKEDFYEAEAIYRKAIALNPEDDTGKYNLGNAYYDKALNSEAMRRYQQSATIATNKIDKHRSFHNLGNTYMNSKQYQEAVESYKEALRNNPNDEETRYNLALAKKMLEEQQKNGGGENDDKNKQEEDQDKQDNKEEKGEDQEGDQGDQKENKDKGDQKDENKEGDNEQDNGNPEDQEKDKAESEKQQVVPGQLSPQQIKSLLEAMNNEEKKVQDKINAKKQKGAKVKSNKDW